MVQIGETLAAVEAAISTNSPFVWVAQLAERWFIDPADEDLDDRRQLVEWRNERRQIDTALLAALIAGKVRGVRRAVLYDVSSDAGERVSRRGADPVAVHERIFKSLASWKQDLARYVALFDDGTANHPLDRTGAALSIQEVILGRVTSEDDVDARVRTGVFDGCVATTEQHAPESWREMSRMISMHGNLGIPAEDADPLSAIPSLELLEYRRRL